MVPKARGQTNFLNEESFVHINNMECRIKISVFDWVSGGLGCNNPRSFEVEGSTSIPTKG